MPGNSKHPTFLNESTMEIAEGRRAQVQTKIPSMGETIKQQLEEHSLQTETYCRQTTRNKNDNNNYLKLMIQ